MLRRTARLRREYLYRKSLEGEERAAYEKTRTLRRALEEGRPIPTELRREAAALKASAELEDVRTGSARPGAPGPPGAPPGGGADDEYAAAGEADPRLLLTTSRAPSTRLTAFAKELKLVFPGATRLNRGARVVRELVESARSGGFTDILVVHEHRGEPDGLVVCHLPFGPTAYFGLANVVARHDIKDAALGTVSEALPHLILEGFASPLGGRVANILKHLFPVPKPDSKRVMTFANAADYISFRHHTFDKTRGDGGGGGAEGVALKEVGPRFEMRLYQIKLGTMEQQEAEIEWALRPYMRSGKKQKL